MLISNIRPYFKKIWFANTDGGCSNDVLVFCVNENYDSRFLYYVLSSDAFFDFATATAKGTKMPRGDKKAIMEYVVPKPPFPTQRSIAATLSCLDDKIELNNRINKNLEAQAQAIFKSWFVDFEPWGGVMPDEWREGTLGEVIEIIDNRGKTPPMSLDSIEYPIIDVRALSGDSRIVDYKNCTKFVDKETYNNWFRNGHPQEKDILISTVGSLAELKMLYGSIGCIAQNVVAFRCKTSPFFLYQYLQHIKDGLISYNIGSVQPSIKVTHIVKHSILIPCEDALLKYDDIVSVLSQQIYENASENCTLAALRDALLPRLMSGEIEIPQEV